MEIPMTETKYKCPICKTEKLYEYTEVTSTCPFTDKVESCHTRLNCKVCDMEIPLEKFLKIKGVKK